YEVNLYVVDSASCTVPGAAAVNFTINYTDTVGAKVAAVPLQTNAGTTAIDLALGTGVNFGSGEFIFWSQGTTSIFLNETTTNCSTGTAAGTVMAEVRRLN
ncbi:MAG: hypothetical protein ACRD22_01225, partial [Terriglobia bacterium]